MIDGITVLSQNVIMESSIGAVLGCGCGAFILTFVILVLMCGRMEGDPDLVCGLINIAAVVAGILAAVVAYHVTSEPTERYRYECLIDESVSAVELNERYVIKEKRGEIYVIEDREAQDGNV